MKQSACSAVICQPSGHEQKHDTNFVRKQKRKKKKKKEKERKIKKY